MKKIKGSVFRGCSSITVVKSYITEPYSIDKSNFPDEVYRQAKLYVPEGTEKLYARYDGWREFLNIVEMDGTDYPDNPDLSRCKPPVIKYENGRLFFSCETEGAEFVTDITDEDVKKHFDATIMLTATYNISVYAKKEGYNNSDIVTTTLCWLDVDPRTEGITNNVSNIGAKAVLIQSNSNILSIYGVDEGTEINVYDTAGGKIGSSIVVSDVTNIPLSLNSGNVAIIRIGEKVVKVLVKWN